MCIAPLSEVSTSGQSALFRPAPTLVQVRLFRATRLILAVLVIHRLTPLFCVLFSGPDAAKRFQVHRRYPVVYSLVGDSEACF